MVDLSEGHLLGHGFDRDACEGCPHKVEGSAGDGFLDRVADAIDEEKCGLCGCPLSNLDGLRAPPENCPRLLQHEGE